MTTADMTAELTKARDGGCLVAIHMFDGSMTEYAEIVDFPSTEGHAKVRIQPYRLLSGSRLATKGRRSQFAINRISYITVHTDKAVPSNTHG